ncbi:MAG TPA: hypothetical protein VFL95_11385, partial [Gemmatimonadales bacterium]|nr:hypothetical protein [Gemmatimonadales bacterium]
FLFLYLRSAQHPYLNEAAPATWDALLAVIRRAPYPVRTPCDDPTVYHGAGNPGRSLTLIGLQLQEYLLYFNWQWAKGLATAIPIGRGGLAFPLRTLVTLLFLYLGVRGTLLQRRTDRAGWWLLFVLWLITGLGLVAYMNFKPAFSLGYGQYPNPADHEVRDRDYFFLVSFAVWGLWAGIGLTGLVRDWLQSGRARLRTGLGVLCVGALIPVALNWRAATRRGPDAMLPADVAYDLLNTAPPYGILVTYGDNDTFPLWWAQRVEGIRRDVTIVCLALGQTEWYMRQLRDLPTEPFDEAAAPSVWRGRHPTMPTWPLHTMSDEEIAAAVPQMISRNSSVQVGPVVATIPAGTVLDPNDFLMLRIVQQNAGRRPIVWSTTTGRQFSGLRRYVVQQGLGFRLVTTPTDSEPTPIAAPPLDEPLTHQLAWDTYRYSGLLDRESPDLEPSSAGFTRALAMPFTRLALAAEQRGDAAAVRANLERAVRLSPDPAIQAALDRYRFSSP